MAKKEEAKIVVEREYNVPLRRGWLRVPKYKRAKKAVRTLQAFLARHMKSESENVFIGKYANLKLWEKGMKNPPHHIKVRVTKDSEGKVVAELVGAPVEKPKGEKKKEAKAEPKKEEAAAKEGKKAKEEPKKAEAPKAAAAKAEEKKEAPKKPAKKEAKKPEIKQ